MDFYYGPVSGNSSRVAFCLEETGASYTPHRLDTKAAENQSPAYLAVNPMGKIPSLTDGALLLWESNAINWYLAEKFPKARLLPETIEGRAEAHRWLFFQVAHVTPACIPVMRGTNARISAYWGGARDQAAIDRGRTELARYLPVIEQRLQGREWLLDRFSIADLAYAPHLGFGVKGGGFDFAPYPRVGAWLDRMLLRPAWLAAEKLIF